MVMRRYFSWERELAAPQLVRCDIPQGVRNGFVNLLRDVPDRAISNLWQAVVTDLDWNPNLFHELKYVGSPEYNREQLYEVATDGEYVAWLDLVSAVYYYLREFEPKTFMYSSDFRNFFNERLIRHHSAYLMADDGCMEELGGALVEQSVAEARAILAAPRLNGPDRQFQDAVLAFHKRPNPNLELAVSGALNAVEGVARIAMGDDRVLLGRGLELVRVKHGVDGSIFAAMKAAHGYASDVAGRHGLVGDPKVTVPIAEYCLHQAAATIVLIARLEGWPVVEGSTAAA